MNIYSQKYKQLTDYELVEILVQPDQYFEEAINALKEEIKSRNLSDLAIAELKERIQLEQLYKERKSAEREEKVLNIGKYLYQYLKYLIPIQIGDQKGKRNLLHSLSALFGLLFLFSLYAYGGFLYYVFLDEEPLLDTSVLLVFIELILLVYLFLYIRRASKVAWVFANFYAVIHFLLALSNLFMIVQ